MFLAPIRRFFPTAGDSALRTLAVAMLLALLAACGSTPPSPPRTPAVPPPASGYYTVQRGDSLSIIANRYGQNVEDLARWNKLADPNRLNVSQVLQVVANPAGPRPSASQTVQPGSAARRATVGVPANAIKLAWPADGSTGRNDNRPGVAVHGPAGSPVRAAAPGRVAYVGDGLRGYGNMVIVDHGGNYMTVYAHNRRLLVNEGAQVRQGQQIAEMGDSGASQVGLYFEVRHNGEPIDPLRMLPKR